MSNDYYITNLLNLKDENLVFSDGIHHEFIKGIKYCKCQPNNGPQL